MARSLRHRIDTYLPGTASGLDSIWICLFIGKKEYLLMINSQPAVPDSLFFSHPVLAVGALGLLCQRQAHAALCTAVAAGFYFIPHALGPAEQLKWIQVSLSTLLEPPNRTNHSALHGELPGLWEAAQQGLFLNEDLGQDARAEGRHCGACSSPPMATADAEVELRNADACSGAATAEDNVCRPLHNGECWDDERGDGACTTVAADLASSQREQWRRANQRWTTDCGQQRTVSAASLLRRLRWATVGIQFDWSNRQYDHTMPHRPIHKGLAALAAKLARPALPPGSTFRAEAAIVNYYSEGDMLGGHLDDMEADLSLPIVSISLGCTGVFLLGGPSREDRPLAMLLRSGDVVLMAGPARLCYHGLPRIFSGGGSSKEALLPALLEELQKPGMWPVADYIHSARININIRQFLTLTTLISTKLRQFAPRLTILCKRCLGLVKQTNGLVSGTTRLASTAKLQQARKWRTVSGYFDYPGKLSTLL
eukprot:SM000004S15152  [mRNA]  locus=s4:1548564:1551656:+ [translate_table: standard]